ncbi:MAG: SMP-30/gluconolactonase/LRE family protein [Chthoniobacter sp.]|nr:SMP-30/gluconolactonase/LRE family protein [Chthoniobacter sp.]
MKHLPTLAAALAFLLAAPVRGAETDYPLTEDSKPHDGVPKGEVLKFTFAESKIFPGTTREYWVYVPKQYDPAKPACVFVCQDGVQYNAPVVFDNLIAKGEMPVTVGVFIMHGKVPPLTDGALPRFNRSLEYDGLGPDYARFVLEEILPDVEKKTAGDGRKIVLSKSGNDRAIGGASSGAICAFTAAWERPDAFTRVFSNVGTYVGLRGGNQYPALIRKTEPKPLRVFLQDGENDLNIYAGDWWMVNQEMERALAFAGYEHAHVWGEGAHNSKHATVVFPDGMRFLWKGWPEPVKAGESKNKMMGEILKTGEGWEVVWEGAEKDPRSKSYITGLCANLRGEIFFYSTNLEQTHRVGLDKKVTEYGAPLRGSLALAGGPDGRLLASWTNGDDRKVSAYDEKGGLSTPLAEGINGNFVVRHDGAMYVVWEGSFAIGAKTPARVYERCWFVSPSGEIKAVNGGLSYPRHVTLSPDQSLLYLTEARSHWVYSYQIQPDGSLAHKQRYYWLHVPDTAEDAGAGGMKVDRDGRLYVATRMGVQVCDQAGRVNCILPVPGGEVSDVAFGGAEFDTLFATCGGKLYKRKLRVQGANAFAPPIKPKPPGL